MEKNTKIEAFYDYLRYSISMAQLKLPLIVIEDIQNRLSQYLDVMNKEDLENILGTIEIYDDYYLNSYNLINELKDSINTSPFSKEINSVFVESISELSVKLEKLDFIRDFLAGVKILIESKANSLVK